jgi:hypothetical protein
LKKNSDPGRAPDRHYQAVKQCVHTWFSVMLNARSMRLTRRVSLQRAAGDLQILALF